jgi:hypothetical protein
MLLIKTPVYSALGKITKAMAFPTHVVHVETGMSPSHILSKYQIVIKDYKKIASLLKSNNAELYLFYDSHPPGELPDKDQHENIFLYTALKATITHPWAQDLVHFAPTATELYTTVCCSVGITFGGANPKLPPFVYDQLVKNNIIDPGHYSYEPKTFPAGNAAIGFYDGNNYMIIGSSESCELTLTQLSKKFNIAPDRIFTCKVEHKGKMIENFFHLDLYLTIVGKNSKKVGEGAKELVLIAKAHGITEPYNTALEKASSNLQQEMKSVHIERLPCIILPVNNVNCLYSYNNCLVENYILENGDRKLCFYLPDFSEPMQDDLKQIKGPNRIALLKEFNNALEKAIDSLGIDSNPFISSVLAEKEQFQNHKILRKSGFQKKVTKGESEMLIDTGESEIIKLALGLQIIIEEQLIKLGADDVRFIKGNFIGKAYAKGGLHCMVKVLERDLVHLE